MILKKNILELQKPGFAAPLSIIPCLPFCSLPTISCRTTTRISEDQRWKPLEIGKVIHFPASEQPPGPPKIAEEEKTERPRFLKTNKARWLSFPKPTCFLHNQEIWPFPPQQPRWSHLAGLPRHKRLSSGRMLPVRVPNQPLWSVLDDYPFFQKAVFGDLTI